MSEQEVIRGHDAARLLNDPLLSEAFVAVDEALRKAWETTSESQDRERERLWLMVKLLARVKGHLEATVRDGKVAAMPQTEIL